MNYMNIPVLDSIRGIMFDLDGTLVDSRRDLTTAVNCMRRSFNLSPLPFDLVTSFIGNGARKLVERSLRDTDIDIDAGLACFKAHYDQHLADETTCYPDVPDTLEQLIKHNVKCAIITNKPEAPARAVLAALAIEHYFDPIAGGDTFPYLKPDPYALARITEQWNLEPGNVLMVGDHMTDIAAAHNASIQSVYITSGYGRMGDHTPDIQLETIAGLLYLTGIRTG
jgi:phosphoglycolate phosphatase